VGHGWAVAVGWPKGIVTFLLYSNSFEHNLLDSIKRWTPQTRNFSNKIWV
jgi:hypothetical protein